MKSLELVKSSHQVRLSMQCFDVIESVYLLNLHHYISECLFCFFKLLQFVKTGCVVILSNE